MEGSSSICNIKKDTFLELVDSHDDQRMCLFLILCEKPTISFAFLNKFSDEQLNI